MSQNYFVANGRTFVYKMGLLIAPGIYHYPQEKLYAMKLNSSSLLTAVKGLALALFFVIGYQVAGKNYQQDTAIVGWVLGVLLGLKFSLLRSRKESE